MKDEEEKKKNTIIENIDKLMMENEKKKIIIIGAKEKVPVEILENIKEHYDCEVVIMTQEDYQNFKKEQNIMDDFVNECIAEEKKEIEFYLQRLESMEYLPSLGQTEKIKPLVRKKIGKPNNKKLSPQPKSFEKRRR